MYGVYDGVTVLWLHPYHGARSSGPLEYLYRSRRLRAKKYCGVYRTSGVHAERDPQTDTEEFPADGVLAEGEDYSGQKDLAKIMESSRDIENGKSGKEREEVDRAVIDCWNELQRRIEDERRRDEQGWRGPLALVRGRRREEWMCPGRAPSCLRMVMWIPSIDCEQEGEIETERHDGPKIVDREGVERGKIPRPSSFEAGS